MSFTFNEQNLAKLPEIFAQFPQNHRQSAMLPLLHLAQNQNGGWISQDIIVCVAQILGVAEIKVFEVVYFYTMFNSKPVGEHHIMVCGTTPCMLNGSGQILKTIEEHLNIKVGETTPDKKFTLSEVECLGACCNAPMLQINNDYFEDLTPENVIRLIDDLKLNLPIKVGSQIGRQCSAPQSTIEATHA